MNEEMVIFRLDKIDQQLAELVEISKQTALQEIRIAQNEHAIVDLREDIGKIKQRMNVVEKHGGDVALKWVSAIGSGILTILLGFIAVRLGLK